MCLAYRPGERTALPFGDYLVARIARIYPLYLMTFAICAYIPFSAPVETHRQYQALVWDFVRQITMTNAWFVLSSGVHYNSAAWSVSVEFFCYLFVFPILFRLFGRLLELAGAVRLGLALLLAVGGAIIFFKYFNAFVFLWSRSGLWSSRDRLFGESPARRTRILFRCDYLLSFSQEGSHQLLVRPSRGRDRTGGRRPADRGRAPDRADPNHDSSFSAASAQPHARFVRGGALSIFEAHPLSGPDLLLDLSGPHSMGRFRTASDGASPS